jgi:hypothetical protein
VWTLREEEALKRAETWPTSPIGVPDSIAGLQLWLDPSDARTLYDATSGGSLVAADGAVARWEDKSIYGRHFTQDTASNRPLRKTTQINGLGALLYDGSNDFMSRAGGSWAFTYPVTVFAVFRAVSFGSLYNPIWDFYTSTNGSTGGHAAFVKSNANTAIYATVVSAADANYDGTGSLTYSTATNYVFTAEMANGSIATRGNGATDGTYSAATTMKTSVGGSLLEIGASAKFARYTNWSIGEVLVYSGGALSLADRGTLETYLRNKWGA